MVDDSTIPHGWKWLKIQDLVKYPKHDIVDGPFGSDLKASEYVDAGVPIIRLQNIDRNQFIKKKIQYITHQKAEQLKRHSFRSGDIVISKLGDPVGKACVVPDDFGNGVIVADVVRVKVDNLEIDRNYLVYAINSHQVINQLTPLVKGSTRPRVNLGHIRNLLIPVPSALEQQRIVDKIDELFTQLDAGTAALKRVLAGLKRYKASVLKAAVEGKLVPQDPSDEPATEILRRLGKNSLLAEEIHPNLPEGWCRIELQNITVNFDNIRIPVKASDRALISGDIPYYGASGIIDHVIDYLFDGDYLLIAEDGANLLSRNTPIAFQAHGKFWVNNHAHIVKTIGDMPLSYLEVFLNSLDIQFYITGTAQPKLTQANLNRIVIPLPPIQEQFRIMSEVEQRLSVISEVEDAVRASLKHGASLRQAILKQAFDGKLL